MSSAERAGGASGSVVASTEARGGSGVVSHRADATFSVCHQAGLIDVQWGAELSSPGSVVIALAGAIGVAIVLYLGVMSGMCVAVGLLLGSIMIMLFGAGGKGRITITPQGLSRRAGLFLDYARPVQYEGRIEIVVHPFYYFHTGEATLSGDWNVAFVQPPHAPIDNFVLDTGRVSLLIDAVNGAGLPNLTLDLRRWSCQHYAPRCEGCGYDLVGLTQPCCPECGRGITPEHLSALLAVHRNRIARTGGGEEPSNTRKETP